MEPLITTGELSEYLGRPVNPAQAELAVAGASGVVRAHCGWDITQELGVGLRLNGSGSRVLGLPALHVTAIDKVIVNGEELDPATYVWSFRGQIYRDIAWNRWSLVEVIADIGYPVTPDVIKLVSLSLAARFISNPGGLKSASVGSVSRTYAAAELSKLDMSLLDTFRLA